MQLIRTMPDPEIIIAAFNHIENIWEEHRSISHDAFHACRLYLDSLHNEFIRENLDITSDWLPHHLGLIAIKYPFTERFALMDVMLSAIPNTSANEEISTRYLFVMAQNEHFLCHAELKYLRNKGYILDDERLRLVFRMDFQWARLKMYHQQYVHDLHCLSDVKAAKNTYINSIGHLAQNNR